MKVLILMMMFLSQTVFAAKEFHVDYIPVLENGIISSENCDPIEGTSEELYWSYNCFLGDAASFNGYSMQLFLGDHALVPTLSFLGEEIHYKTLYKNHNPGSGASHYYGLANGMMEIRYYTDDEKFEGIQVYALIVRMETDHLEWSEEYGLRKVGSDEELLIFHLNGEETTLVGKVDARKVKNANKKAREIADSLANR